MRVVRVDTAGRMILALATDERAEFMPDKIPTDGSALLPILDGVFSITRALTHRLYLEHQPGRGTRRPGVPTHARASACRHRSSARPAATSSDRARRRARHQARARPALPLTGSKLDVLRRLQAITQHVIVPFSGGKDSLALLELLTRTGFRVDAYFLEVIPGIRFVDDYLAMIERRYRLTLLRLPHPQVAVNARAGYYRHPANLTTLAWAEIDAYVREQFGDTWLASGEKKVDSLQRRGMLSAAAGLDPKRRRAFPLADWNHRDVHAYLKRRNIPLPPDYAMFGRSWGGSLEPRHVAIIAERYPDDYATIRRHYPLIDAAVIKHQLRQKGSSHAPSR